MESVPYFLMQDRLSTGGSFILCDCNAPGFPIRYASVGFCELFGYTATECKGRRCGDLVAEPAIRAADDGLRGLSEACGLEPSAASAGLSQLTQFAARECRAMMAHPLEVTGFALVLNRHRDGHLMVIGLTMLVCRHPGQGWPYSVGLQTDVSHEVSVQRLLAAAADGTYTELVKAQEPAMHRRLRLLSIGTHAVSHYLDIKAAEMWEALMLDMLGEVKALTCPADLSTTAGTSAADSASWQGDSEEDAQSAAGRLRLHRQLSEELRADLQWKRDLSEASTTSPELEILAFSRHGTDETFSSAVETPAPARRRYSQGAHLAGALLLGSAAAAAALALYRRRR